MVTVSLALSLQALHYTYPTSLNLLSCQINKTSMLWTHEVQPSESATNFDHCEEEYPCQYE